MSDIYPGYLGGSSLGPMTSFSCKIDQDFIFYNHTIGRLDSIPTGSGSKGVGDTPMQNPIGRPGTAKAVGNISTMLIDGIGMNTYIKAAEAGGPCGDISVCSTCSEGDISYIFKQCFINSFNFSVSAGGPINVTFDFWAMDYDDDATGCGGTSLAKVVTWDQMAGDLSGARDFNFSINNNLGAIYTISYEGSSSNIYMPRAIRPGIQTVSGSVTRYEDMPILFSTGGEDSISFSAGDYSTTLLVAYLIPEAKGEIAFGSYTQAFVGRDTNFA